MAVIYLFFVIPLSPLHAYRRDVILFIIAINHLFHD